MFDSKSRRAVRRTIAGAVLVTLAGVLGGCSGAANTFDPTDWLDFLDTKKPLPGNRKPVFPEGVPGVEQGVPKELYKGAQQDDASAAPVAPPPAAPEPKAKSRRKSASHTAPAATPAADQPDAAPAEADEGAAAAPPAPKPAKTKRKRITAPPPADDAASSPAPAPQPAAPAQQQAPAFPAPLPSGGFSRQ